MSHSSWNRDEVETLILAFLAHEATVEEEQRLARALQEDRWARELFASYLRIEGAAADLFASGSTDTREKTEPCQNGVATRVAAAARRSNRWSPHTWWLIPSLMASLLLTGGVCVWIYTRRVATSIADQDRQDEVMLRVVRQVDAQWITSPPDTDGWIEAAHLELANGIVEIALPGGNTVILEGPVACDLESADHVTLVRGKLRSASQGQALEPFARWRTPTVEITEAGSEFALEVAPNGTTDCHVFAGEATVAGRHPVTHPTMTWLTAGQAAHIDEVGEATPMDADRDAFPDPAEMEPSNENRSEPGTMNGTPELTKEQLLRRQLTERRQMLWRDESLAPLRVVRDEARTARRALVQQLANTEAARAQWQAAQESVRSIVSGRLADDPHAQTLLQRLHELQRRSLELRQELRAARRSSTTEGMRDPSRWLEFQTIHRQRRELQRQLQQLRQHIRATDPEVAELLTRIRTQWKASIDAPAAARLHTVEAALDDAQRALQQAYLALVQRDPVARSLRHQLADGRAKGSRNRRHSNSPKVTSSARSV